MPCSPSLPKKALGKGLQAGGEQAGEQGKRSKQKKKGEKREIFGPLSSFTILKTHAPARSVEALRKASEREDLCEAQVLGRVVEPPQVAPLEVV